MKTIPVIPLLLSILILLSGCFALAQPETSSGTVAAPTLAADEPASEPLDEAPATTPAEPEVQADEAAPQQESAAQEAYPAPDAPPAAPAPDTAAAYPAAETAVEPQQAEPYPGEDEVNQEGSPQESANETGAGTAVYEIDPARSEARFTINEVLRGAPFTVVGVSRNLGGQIALDLNDPAAAELGTILINARDFATDNDFRNNAIANEILLTNEHEFITFEPTSISGLPQTAVIGQTYDMQISGSLTITGQTREVTFDAQVTPLSETEVAGLAALEILYADYGLSIPFARAVESVEDNVLLELEFIAASE